MSDGKKKTVFTFGKGRKRRRQQLRLARAAPRKGNGESSTASVTDSPTPGPSFVSDTSDTGPSDTPNLLPVLLLEVTRRLLLNHDYQCQPLKGS
ncbi:hypothetical protein LSAT2_026158 [Lamellibrachia satsuma]|nr:hypothetical protein LSAT2_026158 [Lamellibrachia satsuma]